MLKANGLYTSNTDSEYVGSTYKWPNMKLGKTEPFPNHVVQLSNLAGEQQPSVMSALNFCMQPQVSYGKYFEPSYRNGNDFAASESFTNESQHNNDLTFATVSPNQRLFTQQPTLMSGFNCYTQPQVSYGNYFEPSQRSGHDFVACDSFTNENQLNSDLTFATVLPNQRPFTREASVIPTNYVSSQSIYEDCAQQNGLNTGSQYYNKHSLATVQSNQRYVPETSTMVTNNCASTSQFSNESYNQQDPDSIVGYSLIATNQEYGSNKSPTIVQPNQRYLQISQPMPEKSTKTSYSIAALIIKGLESTATKQMTLNELYRWFEIHDPKYSKNVKRRQNSLRHCLSYNDCFVPVHREIGKGKKNFFWKLHPDANNMFADGNYKRRRNLFRAKNKIENDDNSLPSAKRQRIA